MNSSELPPQVQLMKYIVAKRMSKPINIANVSII